MRKAVIISDSFKGTISSERVCDIIAECIKARFKECETIKIPVSDGGEGFIECIRKIRGGKIVKCRAVNPFFEEIEAEYLELDDGKTAVAETALCAGISLAKDRLNPEITTSSGVGKVLLQAYKNGCKRITVGLGGSCTNDCGTGAAAECGIKFYDRMGKAFIPTGATLKNIAKIDRSGYMLKNAEVVAMCDVSAVLYGENGAAYVFAPQKGADEKAVKRLDDGLRHIAEIIKCDTGAEVSDICGGGAAGGFGAGICAFFNGRLQSGISTVLEIADFEEKLQDADYVFTGEGRIDSQSADGKVISGVCKAAKSAGVPVIAFAGEIDGDISALYDCGLTAAFTVNAAPDDFIASMNDKHTAEGHLEAAVKNVLNILK